MSEHAQGDDWKEGGRETSEQVRSDWSEHGLPSTEVVEAVAALRDVGAIELPPLNDHVDPDALDRLLTGDGVGAQVSFSYAGTEVYVSGDGTVEVQVS